MLEGNYGKPYNANCLETAEDTSDLSGLSTASSSDRNYNYASINDTRLEEVMAYYHLNRMHDTLKSTFGFSSLDNQMPMVVNAQDPDYPWIGYDNAFYSRDDNFSSTGYVLFGCGNELNNLGLDADVITHEYGHAYWITSSLNYTKLSSIITAGPSMSPLGIRWHHILGLMESLVNGD